MKNFSFLLFSFCVFFLATTSVASLLPQGIQEWEPEPLPMTLLRPEDVASSESLEMIKKYQETRDVYSLRSYRDSFGNSVLHYAAVNNPDPQVIRYLISLGINVNTVNRAGQTPLYLAIKNQAHDQIILTLLKAKANPNLRDKQGLTALAYAMEVPSISLLQSLRIYKAQSDITNSVGSNVLINAITNPEISEDIISILANSAKRINRIDRKGYTPLIYAIRKNLPQRVETLINAGANVNSPGSNGISPLMHAAATSDNQAMFEILISKGANVYQRDSRKKQAIDYANKYNNKVALRVIGRQMDNTYDDYDNPFRRPTIIVRPKPIKKPTTEQPKEENEEKEDTSKETSDTTTSTSTVQ